ncbi:MAG: hypothetical protein ACYC4L_11435 [Chloroflexota bacterium]
MSIKPTSDVVALSLLTAAEAGHAFSAYLPSYFTIKSFALDGDSAAVQQKLANLRSGYLPAVTFGLLLGGAVSVFAKSPLPLIASLGAAAVMLTQYEGALPPELRWRLTDMGPLAAAPATEYALSMGGEGLPCS